MFDPDVDKGSDGKSMIDQMLRNLKNTFRLLNINPKLMLKTKMVISERV
jgi:hypothetical protein